MRRSKVGVGAFVVFSLSLGGVLAAPFACDGSGKWKLPTAEDGGIKLPGHNPPPAADPVIASATAAIQNGRTIFRFDTFGSEAFWGDSLKLHTAIAGAANGGVGPGLTPVAALGVGLKVDAAAIPPAVAQQIKDGEIPLDDPATTLALLQLDAVVGVKGTFDANEKLVSVGIRCALCHSTVDDSFSPGIGARLDGWANRDLNVGAVIGLAPDLSALTNHLGVDEATVRAVLASWGPGKFDAELNLDGKGFRPDGYPAATLIPPAFGMAGMSLHTWTGWGSVVHWNAFVANLEMMGLGTFYDPRLRDAQKFPLAARAGLDNVRKTPDLITSKLADLHVYQLALQAPAAPAGSFDERAAARGKMLFDGKARCAGCHVPPIFSEPGWPMHTAAEIGIDDFQANRSPDGRYRTSPLRGLHTHTKGGFYHDGRFATLEAVIDHYDSHFELGLTPGERTELVHYLRSL
jgi:hypothetical protein